MDQQWQPIETAPMTSKAILVFCPENKCTFCVSFDAENRSWLYFGGSGVLRHKPTHWTPLPPPPTPQEGT